MGRWDTKKVWDLCHRNQQYPILLQRQDTNIHVNLWQLFSTYTNKRDLPSLAVPHDLLTHTLQDATLATLALLYWKGLIDRTGLLGSILVTVGLSPTMCAPYLSISLAGCIMWCHHILPCASPTAVAPSSTISTLFAIMIKWQKGTLEEELGREDNAGKL